MNIVIAIDSFKGSMSSLEAGRAVERGVLSAFPGADVKVIPVADGGEGTVLALSYGKEKKVEKINVTGPAGGRMEAEYCIIAGTAVIEMSAAAGLTLIPDKLKNPMKTTTYGVGEMIKDAIYKGCRDFVIGIGGSATNDAGVGMLSALGYEFFDEGGKTICFRGPYSDTPGYGGEGLNYIFRISSENVLRELSECRFTVACDVSNPLLGNDGCSKVFARQKGATDEEIEIMESAIGKFADLTEAKSENNAWVRTDGLTKTDDNKKNIKYDRNTPGAGAAGGLGYAFLMYMDARLMSGIDIVTEYIGIEEEIKNSDMVITGEGKLDSQTLMGKTPSGIAKIAKKYDKPVYAFAGIIDDTGGELLQAGLFEKMFQLKKEDDSLEELMRTDVSMTRLSVLVAESLKKDTDILTI